MCFLCGQRPTALSRPCWLLPKSNSLNISFPAGLCHKPLWWKPDYFDLNVFPQLVVMEWVTPPGNHIWFLLKKNYKSLPKILWFPFSFHQVYEKLDHLFSSVTKCQHIQTYILIVKNLVLSSKSTQFDGAEWKKCYLFNILLWTNFETLITNISVFFLYNPKRKQRFCFMRISFSSHLHFLLHFLFLHHIFSIS